MKIRPLILRKILSERGLTVPDLAVKAGVQPECIYGNLRDPDRRIRWATLWRIAQALGVEPEDVGYIREYVRVEDDIERHMRDE